MKMLKHQENAVTKFKEYNNKMILAWEMGTGKSVGSLNVMSKLNKKVIILCPKSLKEQWKNEILKFNFADENEIYLCYNKKDVRAEINIDRFKYFIFHYEQIKDFYLFENLFKKAFEYKILDKFTKRDVIYNNIKSLNDVLMIEDKIVDYEVLKFSNKTYKREEDINVIDFFLRMKNNCCLIVDELFKVKNYKTILYKSVKYFINLLNINEIIGLDGTPFYNDIFETYNICNLIKKDVINYKELSKFYYKGFYNNFIFRNLKEFNEILTKRIMFRIRKNDVRNDLPSLVEKNYFVENNSKLKDLKELLISEIGSMFEIYTLLRVCDSYYNYENLLKRVDKDDNLSDLVNVLERKGEKYRCEIESNKLEVLGDILEEIKGNKVIIFSCFANSVKYLYDKLKDKYKVAYVYSSVNDKIKNEIINNFLNTDKIDILLTTDVLSKGLNAVNIDYLINYDISPSLATMLQRKNRIHRINSTNGKLVINLIGDIIERDILKILERKMGNFNVVVDGGDVEIEDIDVIKEISQLWNIKYRKEYKSSV